MSTNASIPRLTAEDCGRAVDRLNAAKSLAEEVAETLNTLEGDAGAKESLADALSSISDAIFLLGELKREGGAK